jgi:hypothetical protein
MENIKISVMNFWIPGTFGNWFYISKFDTQTIKDTHETGGFFYSTKGDYFRSSP